MTKDELIGAVYLRITGGRPSTDSSITPEDLKMLLGPAVNIAIDEGDNMNREDRLSRDYNSEFYGTYQDVPVQWDEKIPYVNLEKGTVPLKGNAGIRAVYDNCGDFFGKLNDADRASLKYYQDIAVCMKWYYRLGNKLQLYGIGPLTKRINYDALTSVDDLDGGDTLPLVAGTEVRAIQVLYELATGQRENPYDSIVDGEDLNNAQK